MPPHSTRRWSLALLLALGGAPLGCLEDDEPDAGTPDGGVLVLGPDALPRDTGPVEDATVVVHPDAAPDPSGCTLVARPDRLEFGLVERGRRTVLPVALVNIGGRDCALTSVAVTGPQLGLLGTPPTTIPAGGTAIVDVRVDAVDAASGQGELTVTRDGLAPVTVAVSASSTTSAVRVHPSAVTFDQSKLECRTTRTVSLSSEGARARVTDAHLDDGSSTAFTVDTRLFPADVAQDRATDLVVQYNPVAAGNDAARLLVFHEGQSEPNVIGIWANGSAQATASERFAPLTAPLDVLFVIDDSPSMVEEQDALVNAARTMIERLTTARVDFRIGATTTDPTQAGRLVEVLGARWIDSRNADAVAAFTTLVRAVGTAGTGSEAGLEAAYRALSGDALASANGAFLRPEAGLAVVVMSDEEDLSVRPTRFYTQFITSLKPRQHQLPATLSAIVLFPNDSLTCAGAGATAGRRYIDVAADTGGSIASICARDWTTSLAPIADIMAGGRAFFRLAGTPGRSSLEVLVDGTAVTAGWTYEAAERAVRFEAPSAPAATATVEIRYTPECR